MMDWHPMPGSRNTPSHFMSLILEISTSLIGHFACIYGLLTKLFQSRWLDIGQVLFLHVYKPRQSRGP